MKTNRIDSLDSLRGLAALIVVFHHCLVAFPMFWSVYQRPADTALMRILGNSPIHVLWDGPEFVLVFFTLSGFVLSLPFWGGKSLTYGQFAVRRVFRIYPTYLVAVTIGAILMSALSSGPLTGLSDWSAQFWNRPLNWTIVFDHVFLMASAGNNFIDTPVWSLVVEMHASLIFPLLILAIRRSAIASVLVALALALVGDWAARIDPRDFPFLTSFATTLSYLWLFVVGALMAQHRAWLTQAVRRLPILLQTATLCLALIALNAIWQFGAGEIWRFVEQTGAVVLVGAAAFVPWVGRALDTTVFRWLGKISYSLYLIHFIVLFSVLYAFRAEVTLLRVVIAVPILSILSAALLYRFVEVPSIAWSHRFSTPRSAQTARTAVAAETLPG
ncbi:MAG: acyltransferase family protein [Rhizomicrobium sp.]